MQGLLSLARTAIHSFLWYSGLFRKISLKQISEADKKEERDMKSIALNDYKDDFLDFKKNKEISKCQCIEKLWYVSLPWKSKKIRQLFNSVNPSYHTCIL